jgi:aminoglycoside phosphotransferase (APT) family kinase protein
MESGLAIACQRLFPDRPRARIIDVTRITDGWECEVYAFRLAHGDEGLTASRDLILRIYQGPQAARKAHVEFDVMTRLHDAGYPVPRVFGCIVDDSPLDKPLLIMERIEGRLLGTIVEGAEEPRRADLLRQFSALLARLHAIDPAPFASSSGLPSDALSAVDQMLEWMHGVVRELGVSDYDPAFAWLTAHRASLHPGKVAVVHQDFHPWNVIVREDGQPFVIDWTQGDVSDSRVDLGWTLLLVRASLGRPASDLVLAEYERASSASVADVPFFLALAAVKRLASITISLAGGAEKLGMRADAVANMREQRHHFLAAYDIFQEYTGLTLP